MLVHKGGVTNFEKPLRIRMIKPILLVKNQDWIHNSPVLALVTTPDLETVHLRPAGASSGEALIS